MKIPSAIQYFGNAARHYGRTDGMYGAWKGEFYRELLVDVLVPRQGSRLLDIGIGTGSLSIPFLQDGYDIYGIDGSQEMLDECVKNGLHKEQMFCADMDKYGIPYKDETFTLTITGASLVYMKNATAIIRDMIRVTEKGGVIIIDPHTHLNDFEDSVGYLTPGSEGRPTPPFYAQSVDVIEEMIDEFNLSVEAVTSECPLRDLTTHPVDGLIQTEDMVYVLKRQL